ncbi:MAG: preprotein translocase subunit YajC, partial [Paracoccaceae bacterium]
MFASPAYAQAAGGSLMSSLGGFVPIILIFAIMYFLMIRPQQKKMKDHRNMVAALRKGDQIVTQGGIIGKVAKVKEDGA